MKEPNKRDMSGVSVSKHGLKLDPFWAGLSGQIT